MHELSIARSLIEIAGEYARQAGAGQIVRLKVRVGALCGVDEALLQDAFEAARIETVCGDAELCIEKIPLTARCPRCDRPYPVESDQWQCPDCDGPGELIGGGDELELASMEVEV